MKRTRISSKLNSLVEDVNHVKESLSAIFNITKHSKIPLGLEKVIRETFKCTIYLSVPVKVPIIAKCCKTILGCNECVNRWYSGPDSLNKPCPLCNDERGYSETMIWKGVDNFVKAIEDLNLDNQEEEEEDFTPDPEL